jgi:hypothetical protein
MPCLVDAIRCQGVAIDELGLGPNEYDGRGLYHSSAQRNTVLQSSQAPNGRCRVAATHQSNAAGKRF